MTSGPHASTASSTLSPRRHQLLGGQGLSGRGRHGPPPLPRPMGEAVRRSAGRQSVPRKGAGTGRTGHRHPQVLAAPAQAPLLDDPNHEPRPGCPHPPSGEPKPRSCHQRSCVSWRSGTVEAVWLSPTRHSTCHRRSFSYPARLRNRPSRSCSPSRVWAPLASPAPMSCAVAGRNTSSAQASFSRARPPE